MLAMFEDECADISSSLDDFFFGSVSKQKVKKSKCAHSLVNQISIFSCLFMVKKPFEIKRDERYQLSGTGG